MNLLNLLKILKNINTEVDYSLVFENLNNSRSSFNNTDSEGTCSSRSSNTSESECGSLISGEEESEESEIESCSSSEYSDMSVDEYIGAKINKFPVQMICLEKKWKIH